MAKDAKVVESDVKDRMIMAATLEERENHLISLALDRAEEQLLDGTASSQVITHFLKIGCIKEQNEKLKREKELALIEAKTAALKSAAHSEELISEAIEAMKDYAYSGVDVLD